MVMQLPDIDEQSYADYEKERLQREFEQKQQQFTLQNVFNEKIAGLQSLVGGAADAVGGALNPPTPTPAPVPESPPEPAPAPPPPPSEPAPAPEPQPSQVTFTEPTPVPDILNTITSDSAPPVSMPQPPDMVTRGNPVRMPTALPDGSSPLDLPVSSGAAPPPSGVTGSSPTVAAPTSPAAAADLTAWYDRIWEQGVGAVSRAGGDVQQFSDNLWGRLQSGVKNADDAFGEGIAAAKGAGADLQRFANSYDPTPPPPPPSVSAPAGAVSAPAGTGQPVQGVPDWLSSLISQNAPGELANDPDFIRTVAAGAKAESGWNPNAVQKGGGGRGLFQFDLGGMGKPYANNEAVLLGESGAQLQASQIVPLYAKAYQSAPAGLTGAERASWVAAQAERPYDYQNAQSSARRNYASAYGEIGGLLDTAKGMIGGAASAIGTGARGVLGQISQFGDSQLTADESYSACGPAAAVRFAQMNGRNPTLREATDLAKTVGWTSGSGMAGLTSEAALMAKMGVPVKMVGADWSVMAKEAQSGNPVTISTPGHYFTADGYDPQSGAFHVGRSGTDLKGGSEWMTPAQMEGRMGKVQGGLLADNPTVPSPSTAERDSNPLSYLGRLKDTVVSSFVPPSEPSVVRAHVSSADPDVQALDQAIVVAHAAPAASDQVAASVGEPTPIEQPQSPVDKLKGAFGDFIDSLGKQPAGQPSQSQAIPSDTLTNPLGSRYAPDAASAALTGQPAGGAAQPTGEPTGVAGVLDQLSKTGPGLSEFATGTGEMGKYSPSSIMQGAETALGQQILGGPDTPLKQLAGGIEGLASGVSDAGVPLLSGLGAGALRLGAGVIGSPSVSESLGTLTDLTSKYEGHMELMTPEDRKAYQQSILAIGAIESPVEGASRGIVNMVDRNRPGTAGTTADVIRAERRAPRASEGAVPLSGEAMLSKTLDDLGRYPSEVSGPIREWALSMDEAPSTVSATVRRWMEGNPIAETVGTSPATAEQITHTLTQEARVAGRGAGGGGLAPGEMPGQLGFGEELGPLQRSSPTMPETGGAFETPTLSNEPVGPTLQQQRIAAEQSRINAARAERGLPPVEEMHGPTEVLPDDALTQRNMLGLEEQVPMRGSGERGFETPTLTPTEVAPALKLPSYVSKDVVQVLEEGNRIVDHAKPVTDASLQNIAAKTGETVERIRKVWKESPENDAVLRSASRALDTSAEDLARAQDTLRLDPTDVAARADVVRGLARHQALQEAVGARRPTAGSMLEELKSTGEGGQKAVTAQLESMAKRFKMTPDEFAQKLSTINMKDPDVVSSIAKVAREFTFGDRLTALWYFNLLSSPLTHIRNIVGNVGTAVTTPVETAGASLFDPLARKLLGDTGSRQRYLGEAGHQVLGMAHGLQDAGREGLQALRYGAPGEGGEIGRLAKEPFQDQGLLQAIGFPGRALEAEDQFFRGINKSGQLRGEAYRIAKQEGLAGDALKERVSRLANAPTVEMLEHAKAQAEYRVFQQKDIWTSRFNAALDAAPVLKGVVPFVRTPYNIMKYTLERSPLGAAGIGRDFATKAGRQALRERGAGDLADRMSRVAMGSTIMGGAYAYAQAGNLTGAAPTDPVERDAFYREGKQPFSFKNPATGDWISYQALQPYVPLLGSMAAVADAVKKGSVDGADLGSIGTAGGIAAAQSLASTQWTQGLSDLLDLMHGGTQDPGKDLGRLATQYASNAIPGAALWRTVARMTDNVVRDPNVDFSPGGIGRGVAANLPGLSQTVQPKLDAFGYPQTRPDSATGLWAAINPFPTTEAVHDHVEDELSRLRDATKGLPSNLGGYNVEPGFVGKNLTIANGQLPVELTDDQQQHYQQLSGQISYALLTQVIGTKEWNALSDADKAKTVNEIYSKARTAVRNQMEPELLQQGLETLQKNLPRGIAAKTPPQAPAQPTEVPATPGAGG